MIDNREYTVFQSETSSSLGNVTTEITTFPNTTTTIIITSYSLTNATISASPNGLSGGAIAGIVIGAIIGVVLLFLLAFIIYKYRQRFVDLFHKDTKQSKTRSVPDKPNNPQPNITYSPEHEYLTVNTLSSLRNQQSDLKLARPNNHQTDDKFFY